MIRKSAFLCNSATYNIVNKIAQTNDDLKGKLSQLASFQHITKIKQCKYEKM